MASESISNKYYLLVTSVVILCLAGLWRYSNDGDINMSTQSTARSGADTLAQQNRKYWE